MADASIPPNSLSVQRTNCFVNVLNSNTSAEACALIKVRPIDLESPDQPIPITTPVGRLGITEYAWVAVESEYSFDSPFSFVTKATCNPSFDRAASSTSHGTDEVIVLSFLVENS